MIADAKSKHKRAKTTNCTQTSPFSVAISDTTVYVDLDDCFVLSVDLEECFVFIVDVELFVVFTANLEGFLELNTTM